MVEEFETSDPVVPGLDDDDFSAIVTAFLESGRATRGYVGDAPSTMVEAAAILQFGIHWLERHVNG